MTPTAQAILLLHRGIRLESRTETMHRRSVRKSQHHQDIAAGLWTRPRPGVGRAHLQPAIWTDIQLRARVAGWGAERLRELVSELHHAATHTPSGRLAELLVELGFVGVADTEAA